MEELFVEVGGLHQEDEWTLDGQRVISGTPKFMLERIIARLTKGRKIVGRKIETYIIRSSGAMIRRNIRNNIGSKWCGVASSFLPYF